MIKFVQNMLVSTPPSSCCIIASVNEEVSGSWVDHLLFCSQLYQLEAAADVTSPIQEPDK